MKKIFLTVLFLLIFLPTVSAESVKDNFGGFYGLFEEISKIKIEDFSSEVLTSDANKITDIFFDKTPFDGENVLRKELVLFLSENCDANMATPPLNFQDAGLIDKNLRMPYSVLNGNNKLYCDGDFLLPEDVLTYDYLVGMLSLFENEILENLQITKREGMVATAALKDNVTTIKLLTLYSSATIEFKNMEKTNVYEHGFFSPYSKNISTGDRVYIYSDKDDKGIYIKFQDESFDSFKKLSKDYTLYKADVYYIDENFAVTKNAFEFDGYKYLECKDEIYKEFKTDKGTIFKQNFSITDSDYINENLLDKTAFIICDKSGNTKYINLME